MAIRLSKSDRRVIDRFLDGKEDEGTRLTSRYAGRTLQLDIAGLGGSGIAYIEGGKVYVRDLGTKSEETVVRALKKATPRNVWGGYKQAKGNPRRNGLPSWAGADKAYQRAREKLEKLNREHYQSQRRAHLKAGRKASTFRYTPPEEIRSATRALDRGDEEAIKAFNLYANSGRLIPGGTRRRNGWAVPAWVKTASFKKRSKADQLHQVVESDVEGSSARVVESRMGKMLKAAGWSAADASTAASLAMRATPVAEIMKRLPKGNPRRNSVVSATFFDALTPGTRLTIHYTDAIAGSTTREFEVGRSSRSAKYNTESKRLYPVVGGVPKKTGMKWTFYKRGERVSMAAGDMAVSINSVQRANGRRRNGIGKVFAVYQVRTDGSTKLTDRDEYKTAQDAALASAPGVGRGALLKVYGVNASGKRVSWTYRVTGTGRFGQATIERVRKNRSH